MNNNENLKTTSDGFREKVEKYMRLSKQTLAELLVLKEEEANTTELPPTSPTSAPWWGYERCLWSLDGTCTNPNHDCFNCPLNWHNRYKVYTTTTSAGYSAVELKNKKKFECCD